MRGGLTHVQDAVGTAAGRSLHQLGDGERQFLFEKKNKMSTGKPSTLPTLTREQVPSFQSRAEKMLVAPYRQPFVVLSSQRVEAAIVGVGQKGRPVEKTRGKRVYHACRR